MRCLALRRVRLRLGLRCERRAGRDTDLGGPRRGARDRRFARRGTRATRARGLVGARVRRAPAGRRSASTPTGSGARSPRIGLGSRRTGSARPATATTTTARNQTLRSQAFDRRPTPFPTCSTRLTPAQWDRVAIGSEGDERTVLALARRAAHETRHHAGDVRRSLARPRLVMITGASPGLGKSTLSKRLAGAAAPNCSRRPPSSERAEFAPVIASIRATRTVSADTFCSKPPRSTSRQSARPTASSSMRSSRSSRRNSLRGTTTMHSSPCAPHWPRAGRASIPSSCI